MKISARYIEEQWSRFKEHKDCFSIQVEQGWKSSMQYCQPQAFRKQEASLQIV